MVAVSGDNLGPTSLEHLGRSWKNTQQKKISIYPNSQKIGDDTGDYGDYVTYLSEIYGTFEFQNRFSLNNFPFDRQTLKIQIADLGGIKDQLIDFNSDTYKAIQFNLDKIKIPGWEIVSSKINNSIYQTSVINTHSLGQILYTDYIHVFQISGMILLVAMVGAIVLTFRQRSGVKRQSYIKQISRERAEGVEVLEVQSNKGVKLDD